ncbi:hypothetical protein MRB53_003861 [Persea americana]|uniref:Uncharacterized protein n=1 Tax=Persea americana TaxID=3435 RepID=A0ACC2MZ93_PERAE|nr:hypothetical protein MRB53_003861 [Persea americana]
MFGSSHLSRLNLLHDTSLFVMSYTNKEHNQRERLVRGYRQHISSKIIIFPYHHKHKRGSCYLFQLDKNLQLNL